MTDELMVLGLVAAVALGWILKELVGDLREVLRRLRET